MPSSEQVGQPPMDATVQAANARYAAAKDAWETGVEPLGAKVSEHLAEAGGPDTKAAEALFNDMVGLVSNHPRAAVRLAQIQLGRYIEVAAVRAGLSDDEIRRLVSQGD